MRWPVCLPAVLFAASLGFVSVPVHAQEAPTPGGPPPASSAAAQPDENADVQTLKINVNLVNLYFSVRDKNGFITNLHKDDCQVFEDKVEQKIKNFTQEKNLPLTIGMLLDTSPSQTQVLPMEQEAGGAFLKDVLTPKDEAFLISFDIHVDLLADYTNSPKALQRALDRASVNAGVTSGSVTGNAPPRGTLLFDAVYLAAHDKLQQETGRKILILLTDGGDQGSDVNLKGAIEAAQKSNAIVYVILISDPSAYYGSIDLTGIGMRDMEKLTSATGGRVINVGHNGKKLEDAFQQIKDELRTQYLISYTPINAKADNSFRTLNINCGKDTKVQARKGYYAMADAGNE